MSERLKKIDKLQWGIVIGVVLPIIGFLISYVIKTWGVYPVIGFNDYVRMAFGGSQHQQDILIFSLIPNLFMFYFSNFRWRLNEFTKGLVGVTVLCLIVVIILTL
ncbi:MAG: hypothetical protein WDZ35_11500 [Crocinitomicaceae bacterium]